MGKRACRGSRLIRNGEVVVRPFGDAAALGLALLGRQMSTRFAEVCYFRCAAATAYAAGGWRVAVCAVNWLAVLVAAIVNMPVGFLRYRLLYSRLSLRLIGKLEEEIEASPLVYSLESVMGLVTTTPPGSLPVEP